MERTVCSETLAYKIQTPGNYPEESIKISLPLLQLWYKKCRSKFKYNILASLGFLFLDHPPHSPDLAPSDYLLFPGLKKTIECSPFFVRRGGHCCRGDLFGRTTFWIIFLTVLQKLEKRSIKCFELRGEYVEQIPSLVAVACLLPGRAKDFSAPPCICHESHHVQWFCVPMFI
jgi:hypothetical protein